MAYHRRASFLATFQQCPRALASCTDSNIMKRQFAKASRFPDAAPAATLEEFRYETVMANRRWIKENPDLGTGPVPTETCTSPELFELERDRIFRRAWLNMGREEDLPEPGNYVVRDLAIANTSVLLVRGKDSRIRAFHNVCVHRGNRLVGEEKGLCKGRFVCRFHSWAYDTAGQLTWVSDEANFYDIEKSALGLKPIAADLWEGFIFINLNPHPSETLAEYMAGMVPQIHGYPFDQQRLL